jgi:hypothetical protein
MLCVLWETCQNLLHLAKHARQSDVSVFLNILYITLQVIGMQELISPYSFFLF